MAYCVKCGTKVEDTVKFCPQCGEAIPQMKEKTESAAKRNEVQKETTEEASSGGEQEYTYYQNDDHSREYFHKEEVRRNRVMGVLSYIGILVLVPMLAGDKSSEYVRHHINQGLVLYVISTIVDLLDGRWVLGFHSLINFGGGLLSWAIEIAELACFILMVMGIVYACQGKRTDLPIIGKIKFWR